MTTDTLTAPTADVINGIDLAALGEFVAASRRPMRPKAPVRFRVVTKWSGQTRSETTVDGYDARRREHRAAATRSSPTSRASCSAPTPRPIRRSC